MRRALWRVPIVFLGFAATPALAADADAAADAKPQDDRARAVASVPLYGDYAAEAAADRYDGMPSMKNPYRYDREREAPRGADGASVVVREDGC